MVTFGEFVQHTLASGLVMAVSLVVLVAFVHRYDDGHDFLRKALYALPVCVGLVMLLSLTANVTEARCQRDPSQFCRYNDNIPFMATVVIAYVGVMLLRALLVYFYRPVRSSTGYFEDRSRTHEEA